MITPSPQRIARGLRRAVKLATAAGLASLCPFCRFPARRLAPIGGDPLGTPDEPIVGCGRRLGGCPRCGSTDRERLLMLYLERAYRLHARAKTTRVLHMAPEHHLTPVLRNAGLLSYTRADKGVSGHDFGEDTVEADVMALPFDDTSFDLILCNHVLEHVPDDALALSELFRVLRPGGLAILQVPFALSRAETYDDPTIVAPAARARAYGQFDHVRLYGRDYPERVAQAGFDVEVSTFARTLKRSGVDPREPIFLARRPTAAGAR